MTWLACLLVACGGGGSGGGGGGGSGAGAGGPGDLISITVSGPPAPVPSGRNADLDFVLTNFGKSAASDVALSVALGGGLSNGGVQCTSASVTCPVDAATMRVESLPPGASVRFRMSVVPAAGLSRTITSVATVTAANDQVTTNNRAQVDLTVYSAEVSIIGSTTASEFFSGASVPYTLTVSNAGPDTARDVVIENTLSSGQLLKDISCAAAKGAACPSVLGQTLTIPYLEAGGSLTFTVVSQLSMQAVGSVSDSVRVTSPGDSNLNENVAIVTAATRIPTSPGSSTFLVLQSDAGDYIGQGSTYSYTNADAVFEVIVEDGVLSLEVWGDEHWSSRFYMPLGTDQVRKGRYTDLLGAPFHDPSTGGLQVEGEGRACAHSGWFEIDDVVYAAGRIQSIDLRFAQHCNATAPAFRGQLHWVADDSTLPPGPVNPPPAGLWEPDAGKVPASGNYVYFESDAGDFIGRGRTELYTQANSVLRIFEERGLLWVGVEGNKLYVAEFRAMVPLKRLEPGYYPDAQATDGNPAVGQLSFSGEGACGFITGWFVVDNVVFSGDEVLALDVRFEQHCEGAAPALRGKIHWRSDDPTQPPGPQVPPPAGLWTPPAGAVPASGNAVYLQSDRGDFIGMGKTYLYTPLDSIIDVHFAGPLTVGNRFQLAVEGDEEWTGYFQAMNTLMDLRPGFYGNLQQFPSNNPATGGLSWYGEARGCGVVSGWFVIDEVTYVGGTLDFIELRFEQHCEGDAAALRGLVRWSSSDTRQPNPPQVPPPGLWSPPSGATPASGNYLYLQSDEGDFIGRGKTHLYTPRDAVFQLSTAGSQLDVDIRGDLFWAGLFIPMVPLTQLQVGYYGGPEQDNKAKGLFDWHGDGRGCGRPTGWFVVDEVSYSAGAITSIELRFEQHCEGAVPALRGKLRWRFDDPTQPPGPQNPPPTGLWRPSAGATPANGDFFYLRSEAGDDIGQGRTLLFKEGDVVFQSGTREHEFTIGVYVPGGDTWAAHFDHMSSVARLEPGYYPDAERIFLHNPARPGMDVHGDGHSCESIDGWFVIDSVTYTGTEVTAIDLRFEQRCNGSKSAMRGRIRWDK